MLQILKSIYASSPEFLKSAWGKVPPRLRFGHSYGSTMKLVKRTEFWTAEEHRAWQFKALIKLLQYARANVPYYRRFFRLHRIRPEEFRSLDDLNRIPLLTKDNLRDNLDQMLSRRSRPWARYITHTGGTTGRPVGFFLDNDSYGREHAFMFSQWKRVGYAPGECKATFRGVDLKDILWKFNPVYNELHLSPFHNSPEYLEQCIELMHKYDCRYIHGYPSAITVLARYVSETGAKLPRIKAVLAASENIYPGQREFIESSLNTRFFSWYGLSERVILAGECEESSLYHAFPQYGILELIDENEVPIKEPGVRGEIVGTGFVSRCVPLIRYKTGDSAVYADKPCTCGRQYPLLEELEGRWHQEMMVGKSGSLISITALNMHSPVFAGTARIQFVQRHRGLAELHVVPLSGFSETDRKAILKGMHDKVGDELRIELREVDEIELTPLGKGRLLVQHLEIPAGY